MPTPLPAGFSWHADSTSKLDGNEKKKFPEWSFAQKIVRANDTKYIPHQDSQLLIGNVKYDEYLMKYNQK
jgi:hypothetical protein